MTFEGAINSIPPGGVLQYSNLEAILNHLHQIATTPPSFEDKDITGVPFYAIFVDFLDNYYGQAFFASPIINAHLKEIFNDYATMLKSKKSLMYMNDGEKGWFSPKALEYITDYDSYICNPQEPHYGFLSWNDWFSRAFKPGARPLDPNPLVIVNSSESFPLPNQPTKNIQALDQFWLKDNRYSLYDMLAVEEYDTKAIADLFIGGTIYQAFLNPWCYHRWHAPVNGEVEKSYTIQGTYYLEQPYRASPISQEELISRLVLLNVDKTAIKPTEDYVDSQPFLSVVSTRHVFVFNTHNPQIGRVIVIEIGMAEVSSCNPIVNEGDFVEKGQDVGHFEFGGSSHLLIFEKGV
jgi:phosphatidylserine decarboxylase